MIQSSNGSRKKTRQSSSEQQQKQPVTSPLALVPVEEVFHRNRTRFSRVRLLFRRLFGSKFRHFRLRFHVQSSRNCRINGFFRRKCLGWICRSIRFWRINEPTSIRTDAYPITTSSTNEPGFRFTWWEPIRKRRSPHAYESVSPLAFEYGRVSSTRSKFDYCNDECSTARKTLRAVFISAMSSLAWCRA
jgi:hypothetical protein